MLVRNTRSSDPKTRKRPLEARAPLKRIDGSGHCHRSTLDLDTFDEISTLESLRAFIPELGSRIKTFAASSNNRYRDPNSFRLARTHARMHTPTRTNPGHPHPHARRTRTQARAQARSLTHSLSGAYIIVRAHVQAPERSDNLRCTAHFVHVICDRRPRSARSCMRSKH